VGSTTSNDSLSFNIFSGNKKSIFSLLESAFSVSNRNTEVSIAASCELNLLSEVVVFGGSALIRSSQVCAISIQFSIQVSDTSQFSFSVFKGKLLGSEISGTSINKSSGVFDSKMSSLDFGIKSLELVSLTAGFSSFLVIEFLQVVDLTEHFSSLSLDSLNIAVTLSNLSSEISALVSLND